MRLILLVFVLSLPTVGLTQSLGEVAKKERERREKNKEEGKKALTFSETEIFGEQAEDAGSETVISESSGSSGSSGSTTSSESGYTVSEDGTSEAPESIAPDLPMDVRIEMFQQMKRHYESQVRELDEQIKDNEKKLAELDQQIRTASTSGGAGLPVAPTTQGSDQLYTGQESETLIAEQNKLRTLNEGLEIRKGQLKSSLIAQGRIANIPAGYLRF